MSQLLDTCLALLLIEPAKGKAAAAMSLSLGRGPGSPSALGWAPAAGQGGSSGSELLEEASALNIP